MKSFALTCLLFLVACGGGGGSDGTALADNQGEGTRDGAAEPTAIELFGTCFQQDATQLAQILGLLGGFFNGDSEIPLPTLDLIGGLLGGGAIPYTWDLDGDTTNELAGTLRFLDENGATTIPFSLADLAGLDITDPASLLAAIPSGSRMELTFDVGGALLAATNAGEGEGTLVFRFGNETVASIAGEGAFTSGECLFAFDFDEIEIDLETLTGYPVAAIAFTAGLGDDELAGTIGLDGTSTATVGVSLNGDAIEETSIELPDLGLLLGDQ